MTIVYIYYIYIYVRMLGMNVGMVSIAQQDTTAIGRSQDPMMADG